jgi:catalase (peroxidase I)
MKETVVLRGHSCKTHGAAEEVKHVGAEPEPPHQHKYGMEKLIPGKGNAGDTITSGLKEHGPPPNQMEQQLREPVRLRMGTRLSPPALINGSQRQRRAWTCA